MLTNVTPSDSLLLEAEEIQSFLSITCSEEVEEVIERGNNLAVYIARTGKMRADAEYHRDTLLQSEIMGLLKDATKRDLPATTINKLVDSACKDANYLATWCERLNRTATHQLDWCRSLVSKAKEDRRYSTGVSGQYYDPEENF